MTGVEIDLRGALLPRHDAVLEALHLLSRRVPIDRWALVGGLMVLVLGCEHRAAPARAAATKDSDVVVDLLVAKAAAAVDVRTASGPRHIQDLAFLLTLPSRPRDVGAELAGNDVSLLRVLASRMEDEQDVAWEYLDPAQQDLARATFRLLTR